MEPSSSAKPRSLPIAPLLALVLVAVGAAVAYFYVRRGPVQLPKPVLSQEAREYVRSGHLELSDVSMGAKENFAGGTLVEITGRIKNGGARAVRHIDINCVFYDVSGLVVLRERVPIVGGPRSVALKPGQTQDFRLPFDTIPESWNQALPQLVISQIIFE